MASAIDEALEHEETVDDVVDDVAGAENDEDLSAPPRRTTWNDGNIFKRGHRQAPATSKVKLGEASPWERPREGFTASMQARSVAMSNTPEGRRVRVGGIATERFAGIK